MTPLDLGSHTGKEESASLPSETKMKLNKPPPTPPFAFLQVVDKLSPQVTRLVCGLQLLKLFFRSLEETQARENTCRSLGPEE